MLRVNGRAYDWGDVDFQMPGLNIQVQEVSYNDELEKEVVYGAGQKPRGYGEGNYKSEGKISLLRDDYDELLDYCKRRGISLYKLVIPKIAVSYANPGSRTRTDILSTVTFTKTDQKAAQGDKGHRRRKARQHEAGLRGTRRRYQRDRRSCDRGREGILHRRIHLP